MRFGPCRCKSRAAHQDGILRRSKDGRPIGFVQIIDPAREESRYWGDVGFGRDDCLVHRLERAQWAKAMEKF